MVTQIIYKQVALNWFFDYIADYICELSYATYTGTNANANANKPKFSLHAFAVPVSGLIPDGKISDRSFPQASQCQLSLVSPVNLELRRRVPVESSNR